MATTRRRQRGRAALALGLAVAALLGLPVQASAAPAASTAPMAMESMPGATTYLRMKSTPATGFVAARPTSDARVSSVSSTFVVTYHGFPANAKAAFQRAVDLWSTLVDSDVPIRIDASWENLGSGVLGGAGPSNLYRNFNGAPVSNTWYPIALANARAGTDLDTSGPDIEAAFSNAGVPWYFGTDGNVATGQIDFTSVVLHEIGHGLGITDSTEVSGGRGYFGLGSGYPFAYDRIAQSSSGLPLTSYSSGSTGLADVLQSDAMRWGGSYATAANGGVKPRLYSPYPYEAGSSIAHLDEDVFPTGTANALMTPYIDDGEALHDPGDIGLGMLRDMGWTVTGAKGVPGAPTITNALSGPGKAILAWTPSKDTGRQFLTGYRVYRFTNGSASSDASYDVANVLSTTITGLANGTQYRFAVVAKNPSGSSAQSAKSPTLTPTTMGPFTRSDTFVRQQFKDFLGRDPSLAESLTWLDKLHSGTLDAPETVSGIASLPDSATYNGRITRLYSAYFERLPDFGGYTYWLGRLRGGTSLTKASDSFAASSEFKNKYGSLSNRAFVLLIYENVLKRAPDAAGVDYWTGRLDRKVVGRGGVMLNFSESNENINKTTSEVGSVLLRAGMLRRMPNAVEYVDDIARLDGGETLADIAADFLLLPEYDARIP